LREGIVGELKQQRDWICSGATNASIPFLAVTVDLTTTANVEYATLSVSFVNMEMELRKIGLCTRPFPGVHTAEACAGWITEVRYTVKMKSDDYFVSIISSLHCNYSLIIVHRDVTTCMHCAGNR
jgi:hypothetical protein